MLPEKRIPTHPGEILLMEFLTPLALTQVEFAKHLGIPIQRLNEIIRGKRGVSPETAWLLAQALGTSPEFWLNLQAAHDLARSHPAKPLATVFKIETTPKGTATRGEYVLRAANGRIVEHRRYGGYRSARRKGAARKAR
jgi:addiction module HigA family antidote